MKHIKVIDRKKASEIIETREPRGIFVYNDPQHSKPFIGIDNATGDAWVEEFNSIHACFSWLYRRDLHQDDVVNHGKVPIKTKIASAKRRQGSSLAAFKITEHGRSR